MAELHDVGKSSFLPCVRSSFDPLPDFKGPGIARSVVYGSGRRDAGPLENRVAKRKGTGKSEGGRKPSTNELKKT